MCVAKCSLEVTKQDYDMGILTAHSNICGDGCSVFIGPVEGQFIYIYNGLAVEGKSPYVDKYGECYDEYEKKYGTYTLDEVQYHKTREDFVDFNIQNFVITKRANKSKVYRQNVL
mmetsp:Transcript_23640/g.27151  ORF Transcript_23640/g.27151 Transcript_23640/m.27151 type:complete len:115 (+) Transcript_23640:1077-1421(+)